MPFQFQRIRYADLNSRQQESYNFQKVSAVLADHGFVTIRLSDDWLGADFIAQHKDGITFLKVQLKGRATFDKKYQGRGIHVCFPFKDHWYLYPHDEMLVQVLAVTNVANTSSWIDTGNYSFPTLTSKLKTMLAPYCLGA